MQGAESEGTGVSKVYARARISNATQQFALYDKATSRACLYQIVTKKPLLMDEQGFFVWGLRALVFY